MRDWMRSTRTIAVVLGILQAWYNGIRYAVQTASRGGGEDPVEGEDAEESCSAGFAVPAAVGIGAGDFFVAEHFHGVGFGEGAVAALLLQIDIFAVLGTLENDSIG